jgi:hypothetical protein
MICRTEQENPDKKRKAKHQKQPSRIEVALRVTAVS